MTKRGTLSYGKQIVRARRKGIIPNRKQYDKGKRRGEHDASTGNKFGTSCNRISSSFCFGYYIGWRTWSSPAKVKNFNWDRVFKNDN